MKRQKKSKKQKEIDKIHQRKKQGKHLKGGKIHQEWMRKVSKTPDGKEKQKNIERKKRKKEKSIYPYKVNTYNASSCWFE